MRFREKFEVLRALRVDRLLLPALRPQLQASSAEEFIERLLVAGSACATWWSATTSASAATARATSRRCGEAGETYGFEVEEVGTVPGGRRARHQHAAACGAGRGRFRSGPHAARPALLHDRPCGLGRQLGRQLGFPTANIALHRTGRPLPGRLRGARDRAGLAVPGGGEPRHAADRGRHRAAARGARLRLRRRSLRTVPRCDFVARLRDERSSSPRRWSSRCTATRWRRCAIALRATSIARWRGAFDSELLAPAPARHRLTARRHVPMTDYKHTVNLPRDRLRHEGGPREARAADAGGVGRARLYGQIAPGAAGRPLHPARRPALREWRDPHRPRGQQGPEGHHRQVEDAGRLRRALRSGLGLPRAAHRAAGREEARQGRREAVDAEDSARPAATTRCSRWTASAGFQPPRRPGRLGDPT